MKSSEFRKQTNELSNKSLDSLDVYKMSKDSLSSVKQKEKRRNSLDSALNKAKPKHDRPASSKNKSKALELTHINIDGRNINALPKTSPRYQKTNKTLSNVSLDKKEINSTPVKPIIKTEEVETPKTKKRMKSVSFMLEDDEVVTKKIKSDTESERNKSLVKNKEKHKKKQTEKENIQFTETETVKNKKTKPTQSAASIGNLNTEEINPSTEDNPKYSKKSKKHKNKLTTNNNIDDPANDNNHESNENKEKKLKKKKRNFKNTEVGNVVDGSNKDEPKAKSSRTDIKPEVIAEDLENLNIGDNAHTLTSLLDDMTVVDKNKKKKFGNKIKIKGKDRKLQAKDNNMTSDLEKIDQDNEKRMWNKRKWNKDRKADVNQDTLNSVIVENLPLKILFNYRKILTEHFTKLGLVKNIGIAEVYPIEDPKPVFSTTVHFYSDGAATKALEEHNTIIEGNHIHVKRCLPPTDTTLVVRSFGIMTDQALSSAFSAAGRIRNIRHLIKGKKAISSAFVEFDGPDSVARAIKMAEDVKIGGKKIHVSKFEVRKRKVAGDEKEESKISQNDAETNEDSD